MAEINVERRSGASWIWWVIGLVVVALVIWAFIAWGNRTTYQAAVAPAAPVTVPGAPVSTGAVVPVGQILADPSAWEGREVIGNAQVAQVVSDRGFWVENQGRRIFVVLNEAPGEIKEINPGQTVRLNEATVYDRQNLNQVSGTLAPQARRIAENQPAILAVDSQNVDILNTGVS